MILIKRLNCGKETLVLIANRPDEGKKLEGFAGLNEPLIAEIRNINGHGLPDLIIRKESDVCTRNRKR